MDSNANAKEKELEQEIKYLKRQLEQKQLELNEFKKRRHAPSIYTTALSAQEVSRYSRQMLVPQISIRGQLLLKRSKILIVGAGGLGSPCALYLAAAGVGKITIVDSDDVEISNLHRQILHSETSIGDSKVQSAFRTLQCINSDITIQPLAVQLNGTNIMKILNEFDLVIDGSDNVATRYMLNDACVIKNKPLVSGSALQLEGQLTVYNYKDSPCYRCIFPVPPPPESVGSCGDNGVLGAVPGTIGVLQALEAIKVLTDQPETLAGKLLLFDASDTTFRRVKLRNKNPKCEVCGENPTVLEPIDYEQFCQSQAHDKVQNINILSKGSRIEVKELEKLINTETDYLFIDVRSKIEFEMCKLKGFVNIPFSEIVKNEKCVEFIKDIASETNGNVNVYFLCRRGNDSQRAVQKLQEVFEGLPVVLKDVIGGLHSYAKEIDSSFPVY